MGVTYTVRPECLAEITKGNFLQEAMQCVGSPARRVNLDEGGSPVGRMMSHTATADGLMNVRARGAPATADPYTTGRIERVAHGSVLPAITLGLVGTLAVLVGAWAGIVPFIGAVMNWSADGTGSWVWNLSHALLWLVPGAVSVLMGLVMLGLVPRVHSGVGRFVPAWAGFIVAVCGAWLVIGPFAWPVLEHGQTVFRSATPLRALGYVIGWSLGPGLLLALLGGTAIGLALRGRSALMVTQVVEPTVGAAPTAAAAPFAPVTTPVAPETVAQPAATGHYAAPVAEHWPAEQQPVGGVVAPNDPYAGAAPAAGSAETTAATGSDPLVEEGGQSFPASDPPPHWAGQEHGPDAATG